ncbi:MAG: hypothetical protein K6F74_05905 [Prevotella sp.]|nr:hypothetical protein [Prevotella sp.]
MAEKKKGNKWNLAELQETLVKDTEQKIEQGFKEIADTKGSGTSVSLQATTAEMPDTKQIPNAGQQQQSVYQEPTQNINIPIPSSQHVRLKVISATSRQTMKDMVVQAIGLWLDVQEGKVEIKK